MKKLISILLLVVLLFNFSVPVYADHYRSGRGVGWGLGGLVAGTLIGAAIASQPHYETVYYSGIPYYVSNGNYYQRDIYGNLYVVQSPVIYQQPPIVVQQQTTPISSPTVPPVQNNIPIFIMVIIGCLVGGIIGLLFRKNKV